MTDTKNLTATGWGGGYQGANGYSGGYGYQH